MFIGAFIKLADDKGTAHLHTGATLGDEVEDSGGGGGDPSVGAVGYGTTMARQSTDSDDIQSASAPANCGGGGGNQDNAVFQDKTAGNKGESELQHNMRDTVSTNISEDLGNMDPDLYR